MPFKCCVTGCSSNYDSKSGSHVTIFRFPADDERRGLWIRKIPRENLVLTKSTRICIHHFEERFVSRVFDFVGDNGKRKVCDEPRKTPILTEDAYPTIFEGLPSYLSTPMAPKRADPKRRTSRLEERNAEVFQQWMDADAITDYDVFKNAAQNKLKDYLTPIGSWIYFAGSAACYFYKLDEDAAIPGLSVCFTVCKDLTFAMFVGNKEVHNKKLSWIFGDRLVIGRWSQLENIFSHYQSSAQRINLTTVDNIVTDINQVCSILDCVIERANEDGCNADVNIPSLSFCVEQLRLACAAANRRRYSSDLLRFAFLLFTRSSACYRILYSCGNVILPHVNTLRRVSTILNVSPGTDTVDQRKYLKLRSSQLDERQRYVSLQLDEIHVNPALTYKSGNISGAAVNTTTSAAHSVQAFMIASLFGSTKEVVSLNPVKNIVATELGTMLRTVIDVVQQSGFVIVALIADNNQVNCKAFEILADTGKLEHDIPNPNFPERRIFILFDTVHIIKCIRNNWLNQGDVDQTFCYPVIPEHLQKTASLLNSRAAGNDNIDTSDKVQPQFPLPSQTVETQPPGRPSTAEQFSGNRFMPDISSHVQPHFNQFGMNNYPAPNFSWSSSQTSVAADMCSQLPSVSCQSYQPVFTMQSHIFPQLCASNLIPSVTSILSASTTCSKAVASLSCLKSIYKAEQNSLIKMAPKLSYKSLYPTNLERQQVSLVLNVFNEFNVQALKHNGSDHACQTADFVQLVCAWWRIVNVKHSLKGVFKRDDLSMPISDVMDPRLDFLDKLGTWLTLWGSGSKGSLTRQTLRAMQHTSVSLAKLSKYAIDELKMPYILLGKAQTDTLERRFGEYRQLCGSNYHVSVQQVLESEKKLRVSTLLALRSNKLGHIAVSDVRAALAAENVPFEDPTFLSLLLPGIPAEFVNVSFEVFDTCYACDEQVLTYISGYVGHKFLLHQPCSSCTHSLVSDRELLLDSSDMLNTDYVHALDRGGLKYPTVLLVMFGYRVYSTVQLLVSTKYETQFLHYVRQKSIVSAVMTDCVLNDDYFMSEGGDLCDYCLKTPLDLLLNMLPTFVNIFMNNYVKKCNDNINASGVKKVPTVTEKQTGN